MFTVPLIALIVLAAAFIQGTAGFGFIFFSLPLASLVVDFKTAVPALGLLAQALNLTILWQHRFRADWRSVWMLTLWSLPGIPFGVWALGSLPVPWLQGVLGVILVGFSLFRWLARPVPRELGRGWMIVAGLAAGALGGAMFTQGPPVLILVSLLPWDKDRTKATLVAYFFITGLAILPYQAMQGLMTPEALTMAGWGVPSLAAGVLAGRMAYLRLGEGSYRRLYVALIFTLGVLLVLKGAGVA